jgi:copper chaperone CopZ
MPSQADRTRHTAQIASAIPGRLRVKLHPSHRDQDVMNGIKRGLEPADGVHDVKINHSTGSITVRYDHARHTRKSVLGLLQDLDVVVQSIGHAPRVAASEDGAETSVGSEGFLAAVNDLNRRITSKTGVAVDLKLLLPAAFVGAGIWSIARRGLMVESVPGWLFLWFAFDMFVKLHPAPR